MVLSLFRLHPVRDFPEDYEIYALSQKVNNVKKILMFSPTFFPRLGGVEKHVKKVCKKLTQRGHRLCVITRRHDRSLPGYEEVDGIGVFRFDTKVGLRVLKNHRALVRGADVVHCHDFSTFLYWYTPFRLLYPRKPVFVTFHGYEGVLPIPRGIVLRRKVVECLARGNICIGVFISRWYGTQPTYVSYGGVDIPETADSSGCTGGKRDENRVVFVGRLEPDTGITVYLEAMKLLRERYEIELCVDVFGDGSLRSEIQQQAEECGLNVTLRGFVNDPFSQCAGARFAFVSGYLAILEAMAHRMLVFGIYDNPLKKDYLTLIPRADERLIVASSAEKLADRIAHLLQNHEEEKSMVESAWNFAREQSWDRVADIYLNLWGDCH